MASLVHVLSSVKGTQRVLVVALLLLPLLLVTISSLPAVAVFRSFRGEWNACKSSLPNSSGGPGSSSKASQHDN